jgi:hypothetical protein
MESFCKITNYETLERDADLIAAWAPELVIADEAQRIKNWNTIAARALKRISSPYAIVLTGTPLENRLEELISIIQFVDQHRWAPPGACWTSTRCVTRWAAWWATARWTALARRWHR